MSRKYNPLRSTNQGCHVLVMQPQDEATGAYVPGDTSDSQNSKAILSPQVDYSIDSMRTVNNQAEKSSSSIAKAREVDEMNSQGNQACVCCTCVSFHLLRRQDRKAD